MTVATVMGTAVTNARQIEKAGKIIADISRKVIKAVTVKFR